MAKKAGAKKQVPARTSAQGADPKKQPASTQPKRQAAKKRAAKKAPRRRSWRESKAARRARVEEILRRLHAAYPDAKCSLDFRNPYELLVATILSAQCTDERVNMVTPELFRRYPTPEDLAAARQEDVEEIIKSTGFFRNKAKSLLGMANAVVDRHDGRIPDGMEELVRLPGVGRKTANVVLGNAYHKNEGIVVDTHVTRVSNRLGLTKNTDAVKIENDLIPLVPREEWTNVSHLFIYHGRAICKAPTPRCEECMLTDICPSSRV
ncbi:MAG: endonuclease III [Candidatus Cloacimonetes bacterium]|nr:endonuclease III [Candidatus Cloacimonadota bacterium]